MKRIGIKLTLTLAVGMECIGFFISCICVHKYVVVVVMGLCMGWGSGSLLLVSLIPCWEYFKEFKGRITGILLVGYSLAPFFYCLAFTHLSNPLNIPATVNHQITGESIFPESVTANIPQAFLSISLTTLLIGLLAILLMFEKPQEAASSSTKNSTDSYLLWRAIRSQPFIRLFLIGLCKYMLYLYILSNFKTIGLTYLKDDHFSTYSTTISWIPNIIGRLFWLELLDKFGYDAVIGLICVCQAVFGATLPLVFMSSVWYTVWISVIQFTSAPLYPALVIEVGNIFNARTTPLVIPYISMSCTLATICQAGLNLIADKYGYEVVCYIVTGFSLAALSIMFIWRKQKFVEKENEKELV